MGYMELSIGTKVDVVYGMKYGEVFTLVSECHRINKYELGYDAISSSGEKIVLSLADLSSVYYNVRE